MTTTPTHLGRRSEDPIELPEAVAFEQVLDEIVLDCSEFTSRCPVTRQPDFGRLTITYQPRGRIAETKSVKLWLGKYRDIAEFNESIVVRIADEFFDAIGPTWVRVEGHFNPRGGISVHPTATRRHAPVPCAPREGSR